jgi:Protein of unknown function (DUF2752)
MNERPSPPPRAPGGGPPRGPERAPPGARIVGGVTALGCLGLLTVAALLTPSPTGHGTHTQLGMPACMWASALGEPCPTCGVTTSFAYAGHGAFLRAFLTQPMGFLLAIGTATAFWGGLHVAATGSRLGQAASGLLQTRMLLLVGLLTLVAWVYKIVTWTQS